MIGVRGQKVSDFFLTQRREEVVVGCVLRTI
jgi:hypothetical protein